MKLYIPCEIIFELIPVHKMAFIWLLPYPQLSLATLNSGLKLRVVQTHVMLHYRFQV